MEFNKRNGVITEYNEPWIEQRADPYVYRHSDGMYYFTASVPEYNRVILRKAKSLGGLAKAKENVIWMKHNVGEMSENIWAPEIHYLNNRWYIYFAAGEKHDIWKIRPFVLECQGQDPLKDQWEEKGKMQCADQDQYSFKAFSLDATVFKNKGEYYFVWAEKVSVGIQISNIYIAKMESPTKLKTSQVLLTTPDYNWERNGIWVNEGASVIKKNGRIYLTYSASKTDASYCMGMLSIEEDEDLLDPRLWKKERMPILKTNEDKGIYGPGHNSFVMLPDGKCICVYHARTYEKIQGNPLVDPNRHAMLMEVKWDKKGEPQFSYEKVFDRDYIS